MRAAIYITAALLAGCYAPPSDAVPGDPLALRSAVGAFEDARDPVQCAYLDRVYVVEGGDDVLRAACHRVNAPVGCVYTFDPPVGEAYTLVYVHRRLTGRARYAVEMHEILHAARGCWAYPDGYHLDSARHSVGQSDECRSATAQDERHCDSELWLDVEREAVRRYEAEAQGADGGT